LQKQKSLARAWSIQGEFFPATARRITPAFLVRLAFAKLVADSLMAQGKQCEFWLWISAQSS
jgi:hypothetical protein